MEEILKDPRFASIATDPKFKKVPKSHKKVKIDKRFQSIFNDKKFQVKYTVDKRGRPINKSSSENFRKYYDLSSDDDDDDDDDENEEEQEEEEEDSSDKETKEEFTSNKLKTKVSKAENVSTKKEGDKLEVNKQPLSEKKSNKASSQENSNDSKLIKLDNSKEILEDSDEESGVNKEEEVDEIQSTSKLDSAKKRSKLPEDIREKLHDLSIDYARGMSTLMTDSSSDGASDEDVEEEGEEEVEHNWGELDKDAETTETATCRLAICNMDWDRIRAVDLMVLCSSFVPSGGHIKSVTIYPSEFGLKRMKEEEIKGPLELVQDRVEIDPNESDNDDGDDEESKEGSKYHMERLRQYQLNRLKYYYAVVICDSVETASKLYSECDGMEYESSSTRLDLRFIPDDVTFDEKPKEVCTEIQDRNRYEPRFFVNTALQQGKVSCTWDETDPARVQLAEKLHQMKGGADNLNDEELQMFLASSSGEEEDIDANDDSSKINGNDGNHNESDSSQENDQGSSSDNKKKGTNKSIEKYRDLLCKIQEAEEKKKNRDVEMEITWGVGLKDKAQTLVEQKMKEKTELTPFEKMIEKKREKRKQKKEEKMKKKTCENTNSDDSANENDNALFSDDEIPDEIDLDDDYFKDELGKSDAKKNKKNKKKIVNDLNEEEKQKRDELELLMADDEDGDGNLRKTHFNLKQIQANEEINIKKKRKKGRKQIIVNNKQSQKGLAAAEEDDFKVDVKDDRFSAVFSSHHFNIDPADSHYKKTKGMDAFIEEKIKRKYKGSSKQDEDSNDEIPPSKIPRIDSDLSSVVSSIKRKTKGLK